MLCRIVTIDYRENLHCKVNNLLAYNEALLQKYKSHSEFIYKNSSLENSKIDEFQEARQKLEENYNQEMDKYLNRLSKFIGIKFDEPTMDAFRLQILFIFSRIILIFRSSVRQSKMPLSKWLSSDLQQCQKRVDLFEFPQIWIAPETKGYL